MLKSLTKIALAASLLSGGAYAQDLTAWYNQWAAGQNAQMQQMTNGIVQQNMNNPQVQYAYQQHLAQGGQYSFEQFCYMYAATGGFSAQGMASYNQTTNTIANQDRAAYSDYQAAQAQSAAAMQDWRNGYYANQNEAGNVMQGNQTYYAPNGGAQVLPYTWQPGYQTYNGQNYYVDQSYNYYQQAPYNGYGY